MIIFVEIVLAITFCTLFFSTLIFPLHSHLDTDLKRARLVFESILNDISSLNLLISSNFSISLVRCFMIIPITSHFRKWRGDYLNDPTENLDVHAYRASLTKEGVSTKTVLFSAHTVKYNCRDKINERAIVFTKDNKILKMDPNKKFKNMQTFQFSDIISISLSPDQGNELILIHLKSSNDLVLSLQSKRGEDLTGELVGVLADHYLKMLGRPLNVRVSNQMEAKSGKRNKVVTVQAAADSTGFTKAANGGIIYNAAMNGH